MFFVGGETLTLLPGTIIRSDGIVATSASRLYFFKSKELKTTVGNQTPRILLFVLLCYK